VYTWKNRKPLILKEWDEYISTARNSPEIY